MAVTRNLKQKTIPDVIKPLVISKKPMTLEELNKEVYNISLKINEIIKYINLQAQPDTIELSEDDMQRKKLIVQPADILAAFADKGNLKRSKDIDENTSSKVKTEIDAMEKGVKELKDSLGADSISEVIEGIIKEDNKSSEKKKKKKHDFYY